LTRVRAKIRKVRDVTGGDMFIWFLPAIICTIVLVSALTGAILYLVLIDDMVDRKEDTMGFLASGFAKTWTVIISLFIAFYCGRFAFKRFFINNKPPEIEERL
jgi:hypothetical protein